MRSPRNCDYVTIPFHDLETKKRKRRGGGFMPLIKMILTIVALCSVFWLLLNFLKRTCGGALSIPSHSEQGTISLHFREPFINRQRSTESVRSAVFPRRTGKPESDDDDSDEQIAFHIMIPFGKTTGIELERSILSVLGQQQVQVGNKTEAMPYLRKMIWLIKDGPLSHDDQAARLLLEKICGWQQVDAEAPPSLVEQHLKVHFAVYQETAFGCVQTDKHFARGPAFSKLLGFRSITNASFSKDNDVIMIVDGDDYLSSPLALKTINEEYSSRGCLCSWGSMSGLWSNQQGPLKLADNNIKKKKGDSHPLSPRHLKWSFSHPRSLQVRLAKRLSEVDFQDAEGRFVWKGTDRGFIFRMIELAGPSRACFIDKVLYKYTANGNSKTNNNVSRSQKRRIFQHFADMPPSEPIIIT